MLKYNWVLKYGTCLHLIMQEEILLFNSTKKHTSILYENFFLTESVSNNNKKNYLTTFNSGQPGYGATRKQYSPI